MNDNSDVNYVIYTDNTWDILESYPTNFWTSSNGALIGIDCNSTDELMVYTNGSWVSPYSLYLPKPPTDLLDVLYNNDQGGLLYIDNSNVNYVTINNANSNNLYVFDGNLLTPYLSFPFFMFFDYKNSGLTLNPPGTSVYFGRSVSTPIYISARLYYRLNVHGSKTDPTSGTPCIPIEKVPYRMRVNIYRESITNRNLLVSRDTYVYRSRNPQIGLDYMDTTTIQFICPESAATSVARLFIQFSFPELPNFEVGASPTSYSYIRGLTACLSLVTMPL